jgi:hypothetical protein
MIAFTREEAKEYVKTNANSVDALIDMEAFSDAAVWLKSALTVVESLARTKDSEQDPIMFDAIPVGEGKT